MNCEPKPKRKGPKGDAPGKVVGIDCKYLTVKVSQGGGADLLAWARGRRMTLRAMFVQALQEFMASSPERLEKIKSPDGAEQVTVLVPIAIWLDLERFIEDRRPLNKQTVLALAVKKFQATRI